MAMAIVPHSGLLDSRSFYVTEPCSLDLYICIAFASCVDDFLTNVLSFAVTIGPYDQQSGIFGLVSKVFGY